MGVTVLVVLAILVILLFYVVAIYNRLVALKNRLDNAFGQIEVQLKRRYDLIPSLLETAKAYLKHESQTLENVVKARNNALASLKEVAKSSKCKCNGRIHAFRISFSKCFKWP